MNEWVGGRKDRLYCVVCIRQEKDGHSDECVYSENAELKREMRSVLCPSCATCFDVEWARGKQTKDETDALLTPEETPC